MKSKLCLVTSNLAGGGAQRVVSRLSAALAENYEIYLILHDGQRIDYPYGGQIIDLKTPVVKSAAGKLVNFLRRLVRLRRVKAELKPAAVISFMESSNFINLCSGRQGKTVLSVRNYKSQQGRSLLGRFFHLVMKVLYRRGDLIVVPAEGLKADLVDSFKLDAVKIKVIHNPYDLEIIAEKAAEQLPGQFAEVFKEPVLLTAGSLVRQKGQGHLVRAFSEIRKSRPGLKLIILGEGPLRPYLEELIAGYGLEEDVFLPGFQANPFQFMAGSAIFVLTSVFEGFPNVLVEAMACGLPVVASDCPSGPREILAPGSDFSLQAEQVEYAPYGVLSPAGSGQLYSARKPLSTAEKMLGQAVLALLDDQELCESYRLKSKERAGDFSSGNIVREWVKVLEQVS